MGWELPRPCVSCTGPSGVYRKSTTLSDYSKNIQSSGMIELWNCCIGTCINTWRIRQSTYLGSTMLQALQKHLTHAPHTQSAQLGMSWGSLLISFYHWRVWTWASSATFPACSWQWQSGTQSPLSVMVRKQTQKQTQLIDLTQCKSVSCPKSCAAVPGWQTIWRGSSPSGNPGIRLKDIC